MFCRCQYISLVGPLNPVKVRRVVTTRTYEVNTALSSLSHSRIRNAVGTRWSSTAKLNHPLCLVIGRRYGDRVQGSKVTGAAMNSPSRVWERSDLESALRRVSTVLYCIRYAEWQQAQIATSSGGLLLRGLARGRSYGVGDSAKVGKAGQDCMHNLVVAILMYCRVSTNKTSRLTISRYLGCCRLLAQTGRNGARNACSR